MGPKHWPVHFTSSLCVCVFFFINSLSSSHHMYAGKRYNVNPISTNRLLSCFLFQEERNKIIIKVQMIITIFLILKKKNQSIILLYVIRLDFIQPDPRNKLSTFAVQQYIKKNVFLNITIRFFISFIISLSLLTILHPTIPSHTQ